MDNLNAIADQIEELLLRAERAKDHAALISIRKQYKELAQKYNAQTGYKCYLDAMPVAPGVQGVIKSEK